MQQNCATIWLFCIKTQSFSLLVWKVLVKIAAAGVNPVDTYIRSGTYARKPALPYTPGSDGAGVVHSVGEGVKQVKVSCFYEA